MADKPLRADARRNRELVLNAAREAFAASGFGVPLDEIAARAGVGPGTVYRHFPTKEALFEAVVTARVEDLVADTRARAGACDDPGAAFFGFLARLGDEVVAKRDLSDAISVPSSVRDELHAVMDELLRGAQRVGAVRADIEASDLVVLLKGVLAGIHDASVGEVAPDRARRLFAVLTAGLRPSGDG
ncbi:TetR/AcrR family transcriptional regulator [Allokutzneria oryzae]|uniref:TetR/AcrR family transcriptional regulator n=1 Tax=Allokutzneria oryzae TaxID=1378989 RepID=A0ABV6A1B9_9PSEU